MIKVGRTKGQQIIIDTARKHMVAVDEIRSAGFVKPPPQRRASKPLSKPTLPHPGLYK